MAADGDGYRPAGFDQSDSAVSVVRHRLELVDEPAQPFVLLSSLARFGFGHVREALLELRNRPRLEAGRPSGTTGRRVRLTRAYFGT